MTQGTSGIRQVDYKCEECRCGWGGGVHQAVIRGPHLGRAAQPPPWNLLDKPNPEWFYTWIAQVYKRWQETQNVLQTPCRPEEHLHLQGRLSLRLMFWKSVLSQCRACGLLEDDVTAYCKSWPPESRALKVYRKCPKFLKGLRCFPQNRRVLDPDGKFKNTVLTSVATMAWVRSRTPKKAYWTRSSRNLCRNGLKLQARRNVAQFLVMVGEFTAGSSFKSQRCWLIDQEPPGRRPSVIIPQGLTS